MRKSTLVPLTLEGISGFIQKQDKKLKKEPDKRLTFHLYYIRQHIGMRSSIMSLVLQAYEQSGIFTPCELAVVCFTLAIEIRQGNNE